MSDAVLVATETFSTDVDGAPYAVVRGTTRIRADHPLVDRYPNYFEPVEDHVALDVEKTTAAPGDKRGAQKRS